MSWWSGLGREVRVLSKPANSSERWAGIQFAPLTSPEPITGVFDVIDACDAIAVTYTSNEVRVTFTAPPSGTGDINHDGSVDGADLAEVLGHWGSCPDACCSDLDGDGSVSGTDLAIVLGNWD